MEFLSGLIQNVAECRYRMQRDATMDVPMWHVHYRMKRDGTMGIYTAHSAAPLLPCRYFHGSFSSIKSKEGPEAQWATICNFLFSSIELFADYADTIKKARDKSCCKTSLY